MSKYKPYPKYKESGVEWLGEVPEDWDVSKLAYIYSNTNAGEVIDKNYWGEGDEILYTCNRAPVISDYPAFPDSKRTTPQDLLLTRNGIPYVHKPKINSVYSNVVQRITLRNKLNRDYMAYALDGAASNVKGYGVSIESLNFEMWKKLAVTIPSDTEQTTIANFLDHETAKIDTLIDKQQRLIELLKEKRQAVISHAVTKGLDPNVKMKDSGVEWLGEVPEHWKVYRIGNLFREAAEYGKIDLPILRVSIHDGISDREYSAEEMDRKVARSEDRSKYKCVEPGDLVYNMMRAWQGGFGAVKVDGLVSPAYVVARPLKSIDTAFVELLLRTEPATEEMRRYSRGITDFRLRLYWEEFKNLKVILPPEKETDEILRYVADQNTRVDKLVEKANQSINLLKERRTALISAAVTGKIDVRGNRKETTDEV